jgi:putative NADPH-quinone reductase
MNQKEVVSVAQRRKETPRTGDWTTLKGKFFHEFDDEGYVKHQGHILDFVNQDIAIVQYLDWIMGQPSTIRAVWMRDIVDRGWALYSSDEAMRDAWDGGLVPRRPEKPTP